MKQIALVTGSHGFIGSHLVKALEKQGISSVMPPHELLISRPQLKDLLKMHEPQYVFHLSAYGNMATQKDADSIYAANLHALWNLLQTTKDIPYKAFVNVSTSSVTLPYQMLYSATKLAGEQIIKAYVNEFSKPIVTIRPFSVYGPGEADFRFIPTVFRSCLKGEPIPLSPNAAHDWIYIDDVIRGIIRAATDMRHMDLRGSIQEFGTGLSSINAEVVHQIEIITGKKAVITETKAMRDFDSSYWVSTQPSPLLSSPMLLAEGLKQYYEWYQKERNAI